MTSRRERSRSGFTLLELLIIMTLLGLLALLGYPALEKLIVRSRLDGVARQTAAVLMQARSEAIRHSSDAIVWLEEAPSEGGWRVRAFLDEDGSQTPADDGSEDIGFANMGRNVRPLRHDSSPDDPAESVDGFTELGDKRVVYFERDGSVRDAGAFTFSDDTDGVVNVAEDNFLEVRVSPAGSARVRILKYPGSGEQYLPHSIERPWEWN